MNETFKGDRNTASMSQFVSIDSRLQMLDMTRDPSQETVYHVHGCAGKIRSGEAQVGISCFIIHHLKIDTGWDFR